MSVYLIMLIVFKMFAAMLAGHFPQRIECDDLTNPCITTKMGQERKNLTRKQPGNCKT